VLIVYMIQQYTNVSYLFSSVKESCAWKQMHVLLYLCCEIHYWVVSAVTHCEVSQSDVVSRSVTVMDPWMWWRAKLHFNLGRNWQENLYYFEDWVCVLF